MAKNIRETTLLRFCAKHLCTQKSCLHIIYYHSFVINQKQILLYVLKTPALLIRMSTFPSSSLMTSTNFLIDDITLRSTRLHTTSVFPDNWTILFLAASPLSKFRHARITLPFLLARSKAVSKPMPKKWKIWS